MQKQDKVHGEGNYKASRDYNEATKKFVESGKVDEAAQGAAPESPQEERDMHAAERVARKRSKGEDPDPDLWNEDAEDDGDLDLEQDNVRRSGRNE
jgi:hypothetical protein